MRNVFSFNYGQSHMRNLKDHLSLLCEACNPLSQACAAKISFPPLLQMSKRLEEFGKFGGPQFPAK
jgi:hypothetical protein